MKPLLPFCLALTLIFTLPTSPTLGAEASAETPGATRVLKWQDGKKACFMLAFDDGAPSQLKNVVPELMQRKIVGTFYLVTGNSLYAANKTKWEAAVQSPYIVAANHTSTHKGVTNVEELDVELAKCNEVLYQLHPERKQPRLLVFGKPGGVPWIVSKEDLQQMLTKHHLADRPPFQGPPIHQKSAAEMIAAVDTALAKGEMGHLDFHGVGGDWLVTPMEWFTALLDKLEAGREQLWITDGISWAKYVKERDGAQIKTLETSPARVRVELTSNVDPTLYDLPLTLSTRVPSDWKSCQITQGTTKTTIPAADGVVQYPALPGGGEIVLQPVR